MCHVQLKWQLLVLSCPNNLFNILFVYVIYCLLLFTEWDTSEVEADVMLDLVTHCLLAAHLKQCGLLELLHNCNR